jgi:hypothetical protein
MFDHIGIDLDAAVVGEAVRQPSATAQSGLPRRVCSFDDQSELSAQPGLKVLNDRPASEQHLIFGQRLGAPAKTMTLHFLDDRRSRSFCTRSAITIAFTVPGSSGSELARTAMATLDHASRRPTSVSSPLIFVAFRRIAKQRR